MNEENIFKQGTLVDINASYWSGQKVLKPADLGLKDEEVTEAFHLGRKLLIPADVIRKFRAVEAKARRIVEINSFHFPIGNAKFVPYKRFAKVLSNLQQYQSEYMGLVENLVTNYETYRSQMLPLYEKAAETAWMRQNPEQKEFGIDYNPEAEKAKFVEEFKNRISSFYPPAESLRRRFALQWSVYETALPRLRESTSKHVLAEGEARATLEEYNRLVQEQTRTKIVGFVDEVVTVMRAKTAELAGKVLTMIKEGKVVKAQTLECLTNFIQDFKELNFVGDKAVEEQLDALKKEVLDKYSTDQLKEGEPVEVMKRKLGEIVDLTSNITDLSSVTGEYKRKISWQD